MPSAVHLSSSGDSLARGMSWPIPVSAVVTALELRPEPEIWFDVWRTDNVKEWARAQRAETLRQETTLVSCDHDKRMIQLWQAHLSSGTRGWCQVQNPALVRCRLVSLPAVTIREANLTKKQIVELFREPLLTFPPKPLTAAEWKIDVDLRLADRELRVRCFTRPVRDWELSHEVRHELPAG